MDNFKFSFLLRGQLRSYQPQEKVFLAGLEPAPFRELGGRDNHYTTETTILVN